MSLSKTYGPGATLTLALLLLPSLLSANPKRCPQFAQEEGAKGIQPEYIKVEELADDILAKKKLVIVDVRTTAEFTQSHIKGAVSIPLSQIRFRLGEIPENRFVVFYCDCPRHLASLAYHFLHEEGYRNMKVLYEGLPGWIQKGYPVEGKVI
jgi:rhodanese-related sulfurtransferase